MSNSLASRTVKTMRNTDRVFVRGLGTVLLLSGLAACSQSTTDRPSWITSATPTGAAGVGMDSFPTTPTTGIAGTGGVTRPGITTSCGADGKPQGPVPGGMGIPTSLPSTVTRAAGTVPAITGGTLLALANGKTAVASDPDRDLVYVVDLDAGKVTSTITLQPGDEPGRLVQDGAGRVHVALRKGGALVTIDPTAGAIVARRDVCSSPRGLAYQAAGGLVHVACSGGELVSLPAAGGAATRALMLDQDLRDVVVAASGQLLVTTFRHADVLAVNPDGTIARRARPQNANGISIFGLPRNTSPSVAWRMVPLNDASGSVMMLHQMGVDDEVNPTAGGYGGLKGCSAIVEAAVSVMGPDMQPVKQPMSFEQVSLAVDVAVSPDGSQMALAVPGNSLVPFGGTVVAGPTSTVMAAANSSGPNCSFLPSSTSTPPQGEVVAVSYASNTTLLAQIREPAMLWRADTGQQIPLSMIPKADTGHQLFHMNAGGGLACASCHPEGGEDGRTWNFACQGQRRTQSIRGKISGTAPFHWDGTETSFSTLMDDVFVGRMSGPALGSDQKAALADWIDTIPAMPVVRGLDPAAVERGKTVFNDPKVACGTCHTGALLTNNLTVDVGTGLKLQVPSLRGVSWRGPFMHNGCANTLADRFSAACGGGDKHGVTSTLSAAQVADLTTYLQSL
jgi:hypothetical protein